MLHSTCPTIECRTIIPDIEFKASTMPPSCLQSSLNTSVASIASGESAGLPPGSSYDFTCSIGTFQQEEGSTTDSMGTTSFEKLRKMYNRKLAM